jgi:SAM-dependent methyltransferase
MSSRASSEVDAYKHGSHRENRSKYQSRFGFLYNCPNSLRETEMFTSLLNRRMVGKKVLDIGCGTGWNSVRLLEAGAAEVHGVDISAEMLTEAHGRERPGLKFFEHDIHKPLGQQYDIIVGRAILHHVDYQAVLQNLYETSLAPGGMLLFMEPLSENLLMRAYWALGTRFHTPDERPFYAKDIAWLKKRFPTFRLHAFNYFSTPAALASSFVFSRADNVLTRLADRADVFLARRFPGIQVRYRSAIFVIEKP